MWGRSIPPAGGRSRGDVRNGRASPRFTQFPTVLVTFSLFTVHDPPVLVPSWSTVTRTPVGQNGHRRWYGEEEVVAMDFGGTPRPAHRGDSPTVGGSVTGRSPAAIASSRDRGVGCAAESSDTQTSDRLDLNVRAASIWREHQADRAWIEWGWCWPPASVARPRCLACASPWPCPVALDAHDHLCVHGFSNRLGVLAADRRTRC